MPYRTLFESSLDALLLVDSNGVILHANSAASALLGYTVAELEGLSVEALVPDSIRPQHAVYREHYVATPRPRPMGTQMDLVARRRDGVEVRVEIALSPMDIDGQHHVLAAIRNVAEYPRVKQALRQAAYSDHVAQLGTLAVDIRDPRVLLQKATELACSAMPGASACVYLMEPDRLHFRVAGGAGPQGPHEPSGEGQLSERLKHDPSTLPGRVAALGRALNLSANDTAVALPYPLPLQNTQAARHILAVPLMDRGRTLGVLAAWTEQDPAWGDDELRFLQSLANLLTSSLQRAHTEEALNHAQRLESVGQLTGGVAHDFNNLLTVIQGNLQVLQDHPVLANDAFGQQLISAALRAGSRAAELTSKLLAFSRRQVLRPSAVDVVQLLDALTDMLRRTLDERIRLSVLSRETGLHCRADAGQLETALLNLAINARDAMPEGGALSFACSRVTHLPDVAQVEFGATTPAEGGYLAIAVSDTGSGMAAAVRERAFEPFFTTKPSGRGTGLGLSTVYGFVRQSHGAVTLASEPGQGTTVTLFLPCAAPEPASATPPVSPIEIPEGLPVLLVEDEPEVRRLVQIFLQAAGCRVLICHQAEDALRQLDEMSPDGLLLSDVSLGAGMRGTELAQMVHERMPTLAVLLMSGYSSHLLVDTEIGDLASQEGWPLLRKPFTREELLHRIAEVTTRPARTPDQ